jgi:glutaredoxin
MSKKVVVYSQTGCMSCGKVKELFSQNKIDFTDRNIATDASALTELEKLGYKATPHTLIDGEAVVGFDVPKLRALLQLH